MDIYVVPDGTKLADAKPLFTNVAPQSVEGYSNVLAGSYTIVVTPTGVVTTPSSSTAIQFVAGQVRTALIMDAQLTTIRWYGDDRERSELNVAIGARRTAFSQI